MFEKPGSLVRLGLAMLAVYRLAGLLTGEDGPGHLLKRARLGVGQWAARAPTHDVWRLSVAELVNCPLCMGVWLAGGVLGLIWTPTRIGDLVLAWLGVAGAAAWLQRRHL